MRSTHIERPTLLEEPALFYFVKISSEADISTVLGSIGTSPSPLLVKSTISVDFVSYLVSKYTP